MTAGEGPCVIFADRALLGDGWAERVRVVLDGEGRIGSVTRDTELRTEELRVSTLLPAPGNVHSHTFQRALSGRTEVRGSDGGDNFWRWREAMYLLVRRLTPEEMEAIAAFAFLEMLEAGFGSVGEFHYLHHGPGGERYDDVAETSLRIVAAAHRVGIGLTLLPVHYVRGGADGSRLGPAQARFGTRLDEYLELVDRCRVAV